MTDQGLFVAALEPFARGDLDVGVVSLRGAEALVIADQHGFERQRDVDQKHVGNLADVIEHDEWVGRSMLLFAKNGDGRMWLIDGQHRLRAHAEHAKRTNSASAREWIVQVVTGEPREAYARMDAMQKKRPAGIVAAALGLQVPTQLIKTCLSAAAYAIRYQEATTTKTEVLGSSVVLDVPYRDRREYVASRDAAFRKVGECISGLTANDNRVRSALTSARIMPILLETIAKEGSAFDFWRQALTGKTECDAAGYVRDRMLEPAAAGSKNPALVKPFAAARGWNAFLDESKPTRPTKLPKSLSVNGTNLAVR